MAAIKEDFNISEARYIKIKRMAYEYYKDFNSLDRPYRRKFLDALPDLDTKTETEILLCTLLFPDTSDLIELGTGELMAELGRRAKGDDNITMRNITSKAVEYSVLKTRELIRAGKLKVMDDISYPDDSISDKEYIQTKRSALKVMEQFTGLSLVDKCTLIQQACQTNTYEARIQISTLLIPNDLLLIKQLERNSVDDIAAYYKVPVSLIEFKQEEYEKQATSMLFEDGKLTEFKSNRIWYHDDSSEMDFVNGLWNQGFYQAVEDDVYEKIQSSLKGLFDKPITKGIKS
jgi:hypothetical protein